MVGLATGFLSNVLLFVYLVGLSLLMIKLQKESLRQRLGLGGVRPRVYSIMFFILILSSIISVLICYFQVDIQFRYSILGSVVFAPIGEEIFFRGYMQGNLEKILKLKKTFKPNKKAAGVAVFLTALLFSISHFKVESVSPNIFPATFVFGLAYGGLMAVTKSITFPIALHMLQNAQVGIFRDSQTFIPVLIQFSVGLIVMIFVTIFFLWLMRKEIKKFISKLFSL
jgi:membrane protease YdiL (CAAX protease family)